MVSYSVVRAENRIVSRPGLSLTVVLDNAGMELVADLMLLWWLCGREFVGTVCSFASSDREGDAGSQTTPLVCVRRHSPRPRMDSRGNEPSRRVARSSFFRLQLVYRLRSMAYCYCKSL
jgi:hypothetical protein